MKIRALICVWLVGLLGLAMCGAGLPDIGLSSGQGRYAAGLRTGLHNNGGGIAGWDTATVLFSPEARVVTAIDLVNYPQNPAGVDTFALPASPSAADIARVVTLNSRLLGRDGTIYSFRDGPSDSARVLRFGTGFDVPEFAYGSIKQNDTDGYADPAGTTLSLHPSDGYIYTAPDGESQTRFLSMHVNEVGRTANLIYVPWEDIIPENVTLVTFVQNVVCTASYTQTPDSIIAVQMTNPSDNKWWLVKGISSRPNYAHASWAYQQDTNAGTWTGTQQYAWSPAITSRTHLWDFGPTSDWTGSTAVTPDIIPAYTGFDIKITNCVQSVVNGGVNNGLALFKCDDAVAANTFSYYAFDPLSGGIRRTPYFYGMYITKKYSKPFGTGEFAFVFQSDDGRKIANDLWCDTLATYGAKMTMYIAEVQVGTAGVNDATRSYTVEEMLEKHDDGHEMGSHSKTHKGAIGYQVRIQNSGLGIASVPYDSMVVDYGPNWMYVMADSLGRDMRSSPRWGKSFGAPTSQINAFSQRVLIDHGYRSYRGLGGITYDREKYFALPLPAYAANGDSLYSGAPSQSGRHVRNLKQICPWDSQIFMFGNKGTTSANAGHIDSVTTNIERLAFQRIGNDTRAIVTFAHDLKTGGSGAYPGEGLNADELGAAARVVLSWGGRFMTSGDLADWYLATATIIDHPFNSVRTDTFDVFKGDRAWGKPHGVDQRWIRGVR